VGGAHADDRSTGDDVPRPTPIWISRRTRVGLTVAGLLLLAWAVWRVPGILVIVLGGAGLALVLSFPVGWLSRFMPRKVAIALSLLVVLALIALGLYVLVPLLIDQLSALVNSWPGIQADLDRMLTNALQPLRERGLLPNTGPTLSERLQEGLGNWGGQLAADLLNSLLGFAGGAIGFFINLFAVLFIAVSLLADTGKVRDAAIDLVPSRYRHDIESLWDHFTDSISRYLGGVLLQGAIEGILVAVALWALDVPYAILLGVVVAVTSVIPYLGAWLGAIPAVLLALTVSPTTAVLTVLVYLGIQALESNLLTPRIQGEAVNVHPILVLLTVLWAGQAFGLLGAALAVPALVVIRVLFDFFRRRLRERPEPAEPAERAQHPPPAPVEPADEP
jgi:predicted PurR-regulated permease PerM